MTFVVLMKSFEMLHITKL